MEGEVRPHLKVALTLSGSSLHGDSSGLVPIIAFFAQLVFEVP